MAGDIHVRGPGETYRVKDVTHKRRDPNRRQDERDFSEELAHEEHGEPDVVPAGKRGGNQAPRKSPKPPGPGPAPTASSDEDRHVLDVEI